MPFACTLRPLVFFILVHSVLVSKRSLGDAESKGGACWLLFLGTQYCWYEFCRVPGRARPELHLRFFLEYVYLFIRKFMKADGPSRDRGEMAMASLRLLLLLHGVLYMRCCPFLSRTVTVNLLAPRVVAGCFLGACCCTRSRASCAEAGEVPGTAVAVFFFFKKKATTTVSHWVNVGIGSDEVSPRSYLWLALARNMELQSSLILRVLTRPPGPSG